MNILVSPSTINLVDGITRGLVGTGGLHKTEQQSVVQILREHAAGMATKTAGPSVLAVGRAAERLSLSRKTISRMVKSGELQGVHLRSGSLKTLRILQTSHAGPLWPFAGYAARAVQHDLGEIGDCIWIGRPVTEDDTEMFAFISCEWPSDDYENILSRFPAHLKARAAWWASPEAEGDDRQTYLDCLACRQTQQNQVRQGDVESTAESSLPQGAVEGPSKEDTHIEAHVPELSGRFVDAASYHEESPPKSAPVLAGVFDAGDKVALLGASKTRKTFALILMAMCIATGRPIVGLDVPKQPGLLFVQFEVKTQHFHRRVHNMAHSLGVDSRKLRGQMERRGYTNSAPWRSPAVARWHGQKNGRQRSRESRALQL